LNGEHQHTAIRWEGT